MSKLEHYSQLKHHIKCEQYLTTNILNRKQRSVLDQGHYQSKMKRGGEEVCLEKECNTTIIENISHFMLKLNNMPMKIY